MTLCKAQRTHYRSQRTGYRCNVVSAQRRRHTNTPMFEKVPTLITVAVLSGIFACLERYSRTARSRFWKIGWFLVFIHFLALLFETPNAQVPPWLTLIDWGALQASAIAFLVSVSSVAQNRSKRVILLLATGIDRVCTVGFLRRKTALAICSVSLALLSRRDRLFVLGPTKILS